MTQVSPPSVEGRGSERPLPPPLLDPDSVEEVPAFIQSPGTLSGRVENADGTFSFVLGDLASLRYEEFLTDDYIEVWQNVNLTKMDKVITSANIPSTPAADDWALQILIDSTVFAEKIFPQRVEPTKIYLTAPVSRQFGVSRVAVRLVRR